MIAVGLYKGFLALIVLQFVIVGAAVMFAWERVFRFVLKMEAYVILLRLMVGDCDFLGD